MITGQPTEMQTVEQYKKEKGIPNEKINIQVDFWRGATHPALINGINDGNVNSFYDAPLVSGKESSNPVTVPEAPSQNFRAQPNNPAPVSAIPSPCCGTRLEQLNRTRVRCSSCGAEYIDNEGR